MMPRIFTCILCFFLSIGVCSSQMPVNTDCQLWKVSGNGASTSYICPGLHVKDRPAFQFGSLVLDKFSECGTFVTEFSSDSLSNYLFANSKGDTFNYVRLVNDDEGYEKINKDLMTAYGFNIEDLKVKHPFLIKQLLPTHQNKEESMPIFQDAYLYNLARMQKKKISSLTIWGDYPAVFSGATIEQFRSVTTGSIDVNIQEQINSLIAEKIDKQVVSEQSFIVVSSDRLHGDQGVLAKLKGMGYIVDPVIGAGSAESSRPMGKNDKPTWYTYSDEQIGYSLSLPDRPQILNDVSTEAAKYVYYDFTTSSLYYFRCFAHDYTAYFVESGDALYSFVEKLCVERGLEIVKEKRIRNQYVNGKQFIFKSLSGDFAMVQIFINREKIYVLAINGSEECLIAPDASRFFNSFRIEDKNVAASNWVSFFSSSGAATVSLPEEPTYEYFEVGDTENPDGEPYRLHVYQSVDVEHSIFYFYRYNDLPKGQVIFDDEEFFDSMEESFIENLGVLPSDWNAIVKEGYPGREYYFYNAVGNSFAMIDIFLRGNRAYLIMAQMDMSLCDSTYYHEFFNSFRFQDYMHDTWVEFTQDELGLSISLPSEPTIEADTFLTSIYSELDYSYTFFATDTNSGIPYFTICDVYPEYYRVTSADSFLTSAVESFYELGDSILYEKPIVVDGYNGRELLMKSFYVHTYLKAQIILRDNYLYQIYSYLPREELYTGQTNSFFSSAKILPLENTSNMLENKAPKIFDDLLSTDSLTQFRAYKALDYYPFSEDDLPLLYKAIKMDYSGDTIVNQAIKYSLLYALEFTNNETTVPFISDIYDLYGNEPVKQILMLEVLSVMQSPMALDLLISKLAKPPKAEDYLVLSDFFSPFVDSLELFAAHYSDFVHLFNSPYYDTHMGEITNELIDSNIVSISFFEPYKNQYKSYFTGLLQGFEKTDQTNDDIYNNLLATTVNLMNILGHFSLDSDLENELYKLLDRDEKNLKLEAALLLEKNTKFVPSKIWKDLLDDDLFRFETLKALDKIGRLDNVAEKYRNQRSVALIDLKNWMLNIEDKMRVKEAGERIINYGGEKVRLYVYKVYSKKDDIWYMAVSGPQPVDVTKLNFNSELTDFFFVEYNESNLELLIEMMESDEIGD